MTETSREEWHVDAPGDRQPFIERGVCPCHSGSLYESDEPTMEELEDVKTAVSEAVTNAVIHGYSDEIGIIYIEARIEGEELIISVRDEGKGILDVEKAMEPMYTTDTTGERSGMGFSFMEAFMDEVEVESKVGCGTCVTMKKRIGRRYMNKEQEEKETAESYG